MDLTEAGIATEASAPAHLYARFSRRFWALAIDSAVYAVSIVLLIVLLEVVRGADRSTRTAFLLWLGFLCLYEPILVWLRGATLGHMAANIRVVDLRTGGNPTFLRAFARFWLKAFVGLVAFAFMGTTRRHQALHDLAAGTTVEIADPEKALPAHFVTERDPLSTMGLPSRLRRVLVILAYSMISWVLLGVALISTQSEQCLERDFACTPGERLLERVLGLLFVGLLATWIVFGWNGRLLGARRTRQVVSPSQPGTA